MRLSLLLLMFLLSTTTALAHAPANAVFWPVPWTQPRTLAYDSVLVSERLRAGATTRMTLTAVETIATDPAAAPGRGQVWTSADRNMVFGEGTPKETELIAQAMEEALLGLSLRVTLDGDGSAVGLANLDVLGPQIRAAMDAALAQTQAWLLAGMDPQARATLEPRMKASAAAFNAQMGSDATLLSLLMRTPSSYNFPGRGGLAPGETMTVDAPTPSALGGTPFPTRMRLHLAADEVAPGVVAFEVETTMDPSSALPQLVEVVEKMIGQPLPDDVRAQLPERIEVRTATTWHIERATGIVRRMQRIETRKILEAADTSTLTMTLRGD